MTHTNIIALKYYVRLVEKSRPFSDILLFTEKSPHGQIFHMVG